MAEHTIYKPIRQSHLTMYDSFQNSNVGRYIVQVDNDDASNTDTTTALATYENDVTKAEIVTGQETSNDINNDQKNNTIDWNYVYGEIK